MEIFWTIIAGAGTLVTGQVILKLIIEPVQKMKSTIGEISYALIFNSNVYANPRPLADEQQSAISEEFRVLASKLQSDMHLVPWFSIVGKLFGLPTTENVQKSSRELIGLHNGHADSPLANQDVLNLYRAQHVRQALGIYISENELLDPEKEKEFVKAKAPDQ